jgi:hypothetical protein
MPDRTTLERLAPLTGLLFLALVIASSIIGGEGPDADDSTQTVLDFWADDDTQIASALLAGLAAVPLVWFGGSIRDHLRAVAPASERLATLLFGGFVMVAVGVTAFSGFQLAAADTIGDVPPEVTQTLSVLYSDFFLPFAAGVLILFLAVGTAILRYRILPTWLGWGAFLIVIGFIVFFPVGGILAAIWIATVSILLYQGWTPVGADVPA